MPKKFIALIFSLILVMSLTISASATADQPYGSYSTSISDGWTKDTATSTITKCTCTPVDNYLMAGIQIQYIVDRDYNWNPVTQGTYYYDSGTNVSSRSKSLSANEITFAEGWFQARCGDGTMWSDYSSDSN